MISKNPITKSTPVTHIVCWAGVRDCPGWNATSTPSSISLSSLEGIHQNAEAPPDFHICISAFYLCQFGKQRGKKPNTPLCVTKAEILRFLVEPDSQRHLCVAVPWVSMDTRQIRGGHSPARDTFGQRSGEFGSRKSAVCSPTRPFRAVTVTERSLLPSQGHSGWQRQRWRSQFKVLPQ